MKAVKNSILLVPTFLYLISVFMFMFSKYLVDKANDIKLSSNSSDFILLTFIILAISTLMIIVQLILNIINVTKNKKYDINYKIKWVILLCCFNIFIFPYYSLKYIINDKKYKLKILFYYIIIGLVYLVSFVLIKKYLI